MPVTIEKLSELSNYDAPVPVVMGPGDSNIPSIAMMPGRLRCTEAVQWLLASGLHVVAIILGGISCLWLLQVAAAPMTGGSTGKRGTQGELREKNSRKLNLVVSVPRIKISLYWYSYQNMM
jgi:hypothetical protein